MPTPLPASENSYSIETDDGFVPRQTCLQRLRALLREDRTLAPGMSGPRGLPYGGFALAEQFSTLEDPVLTGNAYLWLEWPTGEVKAKLLDETGAHREPTQEELQTILVAYEQRVADYVANPEAWFARNMPLAAGQSLYSSICPEVLPPSYPIH